MFRKRVVVCVLSLICLAKASLAQNAAPSSGEITVRTSQIIDSAAMRVGQAVQGSVTKSSAPEIPNGSIAFIGVLPDQGGLTLRLLRIQANGQLMRVSSSSVQLASGLFNKMNNMKRQPGEPSASVSGARIYLHANTDIVFTLAPAPAAPAPPNGRQGIARQAPPPPKHPANTARDLPPAAPGYPPLHASYDAQENCWWVPFLSEKFAFEAAVQTCAEKKSTSLVVEMEDGLGLQYQGNTPLDPPSRFVRVLSKPAEQTIEAAIKQQFIMKLKVPAARAACKAVKGMGNNTPDDTGTFEDRPGLTVYSVTATGPYSKQKKFQGEEAEYPCPDLQSNDAISMYFQYDPSETKTKFLFFQEDDNGTVLDSKSIHFAEQQ